MAAKEVTQLFSAGADEGRVPASVKAEKVGRGHLTGVTIYNFWFEIYHSVAAGRHRSVVNCPL